MKESIIILLLTVALVGCDSTNSTRVCNQTGQGIYLTLKFDTGYISAQGKEPREYVKIFHDYHKNLVPIHFDTVNFISMYLIKSDSCGEIEGFNSRRPYFEYFREMAIMTKSDTIKLKSKGEMRKAFDADRTNPQYHFDFVIK